MPQEPNHRVDAGKIPAPGVSQKKSDASAFLFGIIVATIVGMLCAVALDGGVLFRTACFTAPIYAVSTALIWHRAKAHPLSVADRLVVMVGFPVYPALFHLLMGYKSMLIAEGVITWPGVF